MLPGSCSGIGITVQVDAQEIGDKGDPTELIAARMAAAEHGCLAIKVRGPGHLESLCSQQGFPEETERFSQDYNYNIDT